jgi:hypothetical protein
MVDILLKTTKKSPEQFIPTAQGIPTIQANGRNLLNLVVSGGYSGSGLRRIFCLLPFVLVNTPHKYRTK